MTDTCETCALWREWDCDGTRGVCDLPRQENGPVRLVNARHRTMLVRPNHHCDAWRGVQYRLKGPIEVIIADDPGPRMLIQGAGQAFWIRRTDFDAIFEAVPPAKEVA